MSKLVRVKISALGTYVPPRLLTNADLEKMVETTDQWIIERTGIRERHIVDKGVATSDLAVEAAKKALAQRGIEPPAISTRSSWARLPRTCFFHPPLAWCSTSWEQKESGDLICRRPARHSCTPCRRGLNSLPLALTSA